MKCDMTDEASCDAPLLTKAANDKTNTMSLQLMTFRQAEKDTMQPVNAKFRRIFNEFEKRETKINHFIIQFHPQLLPTLLQTRTNASDIHILVNA